MKRRSIFGLAVFPFLFSIPARASRKERLEVNDYVFSIDPDLSRDFEEVHGIPLRRVLKNMTTYKTPGVHTFRRYCPKQSEYFDVRLNLSLTSDSSFDITRVERPHRYSWLERPLS